MLRKLKFRIICWLARRNIQGVVRSQFSLYKDMRERLPNESEENIAIYLLGQRFQSVIKPTRRERERLAMITDNELPANLLETCLEILEVETSIGPDEPEYEMVVEIISKELENLGYQHVRK